MRLRPIGMLVIFGVLGGCAPTSESPPSSEVQAARGEWVSLFDGETLEGWHQENGTATYRVEDGAITGRSMAGSPNSFLVTDRTYDDFELEFEVLADTGFNSGVQIRSRTGGSSRQSDAPDRVNGPQVEIESSGPDGAEAGYVYGEASGGWLTPDERLTPHRAFKDGEWNHYRIVAQGPRIQTYINDQPIEDLTLEADYHRTYPSGFIGLQVHSVRDGSRTYEVRWRNLRLRELNGSGTP